jgi:DNA-binding NtrC family response regulator
VSGRLGALTQEFRRRVIAHHLAATEGNVCRAARSLGIQRTYLARLMRGYGLVGSGRRDWARKEFGARPGGFRL